jgi:serine/threonine protein phosphatase PrpC
VPALKKLLSLTALGFDSLNRRKRGSKDAAAARDSSRPLLSTNSKKHSTAGLPAITPAVLHQHTRWQALKSSGRRLLPSCCLPPRCDDEQDSLLDPQQQLQETSHAGSSADHHDAVDCKVFLLLQPQQLKQCLEEQEPSQSETCCAGPIIPAVQPAASAAGTVSAQRSTVCSAPAAALSHGPVPDSSSTPQAPSCVPAAPTDIAQLPRWSFGSTCIQNKRTHMEDCVLKIDLTDHPVFSFAQHRAGLCAVFDGHGGHQTAAYLAGNIVQHIISQGAAALQEQPKSALKHAIQCAERELLSAWVPGAGHASGSTLCLTLLIDDVLYVAHVGDSRAVLAQGANAVPLTADHKPSSPSEADRIHAADPTATVTADGYLYGELAVSRALGSAHLKADPTKRAFVAAPEVTSLQLGPADDFVLLGTDGLWDQVGSQDAVAAARRSLADRNDAAAASAALVDRAQKFGSGDNISVVVLLLHGRALSCPKATAGCLAGSRWQRQLCLVRMRQLRLVRV